MTGELVIEKYVAGWRAVGVVVRRPSVWLPLTVLAAFKITVMTAVYYFWHPAYYAYMAPSLQGVFGEPVLHFPGHVLLMGTIYRVYDLVITVVLGFALVAWSLARIAASVAGDDSPGHSRSGRTARWIPHFVLAWTLFAGVWKGIPLLVSGLTLSLSNPKFQMLAALLGLGASLALRGILLYAPVFLVFGKNLTSALNRSYRFAREWSWLTALVILTGWAIQAPLDYMISKAGVLIDTIGAGSVLAVIIFNIILEVAALMYIFVSATKVVAGESDQG